MPKKFKIRFLYLLLLFILYSSTCKDYESCNYPPYFFFTTIKHSDSFITSQYQYAYGIGKESKLILKNTRNDDSLSNYFDVVYKDTNSLYFILPANLETETVYYCLVDKLLNRDTVGISYTRKLSILNTDNCRKSYPTLLSSKIIYTSNNLLKDSCRIDLRFEELYHLVLFRK